jgi:hypothetical protein
MTPKLRMGTGVQEFVDAGGERFNETRLGLRFGAVDSGNPGL